MVTQTSFSQYLSLSTQALQVLPMHYSQCTRSCRNGCANTWVLKRPPAGTVSSQSRRGPLARRGPPEWVQGFDQRSQRYSRLQRFRATKKHFIRHVTSVVAMWSLVGALDPLWRSLVFWWHSLAQAVQVVTPRSIPSQYNRGNKSKFLEGLLHWWG